MTDDKWLEIGTIVAPQGVSGAVRVYPNSDFPERFLEPGRRWLRRTGTEEPEPIELLGGRFIPGKGIYAVEIAGIEDREAAETLRGSHLLVEMSDRPALEEDEFHVLDLIGLDVFNQVNGEMLGTVIDVIAAGNALLQVQLNQSAAPASPTDEPDVATVEEIHPSARRGGRKRKRQPKPSASKTVLIPFVKEIVPVVDLPAHRLEVMPPPGLLEIESP